MKYRLGSAFPRSLTGYAYPEKKRRVLVRRTTNSGTVYEVSVTDSVSLDDEINSFRVHFEDVTDSITISQIIKKIGHIYLVSVEHDATIGESLKLNRVYSLSLVDTVTTVDSCKYFGTDVIDNVTIDHVITFNRVLKRTISHNVATSQIVFLNSPRTLSLVDRITVSDEIAVRNPSVHVSVTDSVHIVDYIVFRNSVIHISVVDNITVSQYQRVIGAVINVSITQSLTVSQKINNKNNIQRIEQDINVFHTISKRRYTNQVLITTPTLTSHFLRELTYEITTTPTLISNFNRQVTYHQSLTQTQTVSSTFTSVLFIPTPPKSPTGITPDPITPRPNAPGVITVYGYMTLLESKYSSIVLPVPELNDSQKHNDVVEIKRSMDGNLKAYIKTSRTEQLNYSWLLDFDKGLEFKEFIKANMTETIRLTNWKGEIWSGHIISDDFQVKAESKYGGQARQKTSATILFEGVKING